MGFWDSLTGQFSDNIFKAVAFISVFAVIALNFIFYMLENFFKWDLPPVGIGFTLLAIGAAFIMGFEILSKPDFTDWKTWSTVVIGVLLIVFTLYVVPTMLPESFFGSIIQMREATVAGVQSILSP